MHLWRINRYAADDPDKDAVTHVFVLVLLVGTSDRQVVSDDMVFQDLSMCLTVAKMLVMRFGYERPQDRALAYCIPKRIAPEA